MSTRALSIAGTLLVAALLLEAGCGYRMSHTVRENGERATVSVETLGNDSLEPGLEMIVSEAIRHEILRRGALRLVSRPSDADFVVSGRVLPLRINRRSFSSVVLTLEYQVVARIDLHVERQGGESYRLAPGSLRESELYLASADIEASRKNRLEALRRISDMLASRAHDALEQELAQ